MRVQSVRHARRGGSRCAPRAGGGARAAVRAQCGACSARQRACAMLQRRASGRRSAYDVHAPRVAAVYAPTVIHMSFAVTVCAFTAGV